MRRTVAVVTALMLVSLAMTGSPAWGASWRWFHLTAYGFHVIK